MKKVLIIAFYFPPLSGGGVQRPLKFVKYLPHSGWKPIVLTINPDNVKSYVRDESLLEELPEEAEIYRTFYPDLTRLPLFRGSPARVFFEPFRNRFLIPSNEVSWNYFAYRKAIKIIAKEKPDVIMATSPPNSVQLLGRRLSDETGIPYIADIRDEWTTDPYLTEAFERLPERRKSEERRMERECFNAAQRLVVISGLMKKSIERNAGIEPGKFRIVPNGFDEEDFSGYDDTMPSSGEKFKVLLMGNLSMQRVTENLVRAVKLAIDTGHIDNEKFEINVLTQSDPKHIRRHIPDKKYDVFNFHGYKSHAGALKMMEESHAFLMLVTEHAKSVISGRIFEYIRGRRPVIAFVPVDGEAAEIIRRTNTGSVCPPSNKEEMSKVLSDYYARWTEINWGYSPATEEICRFDRRVLTAKLAEVLEEVSG
ncbi:MAG: glycosyltransferase [candidate division Zixibacteria bacterium]|nr:glycosyltransferase [candidate division Zixibacteria bacterium]